MRSNYSLKSICFSQIIKTINAGGNVDLGKLPPHLAREIITSIQSTSSLKRVNDFNSEYAHLNEYFDDAWKVVVRSKYFVSSPLPTLPQGQNWYQYFFERSEKEKREDEEMRRIIQEAPKEKKKSKELPKNAKVLLQNTKPRTSTSNQLTPAMKRILRRLH